VWGRCVHFSHLTAAAVGMPSERRIYCSATLIDGQEAAGLHHPTAVAVLPSGDLVVSDASSRVMLVSSDGKWKKTLGCFGTGSTFGLAVAGKGPDEHLFVADTHYNRIHKVRLSDSFTMATATKVGSRTTMGPLTLRQPHGLAVAGDILYVADCENHRIVAFSAASVAPPKVAAGEVPPAVELQWLFTLGSMGREPGSYQYPKGIAVLDRSDDDNDSQVGGASDHELFVCDSRNHRIQCVSGDGRFLRALGGRLDQRGAGTARGRSTPDDGAGLFSYPSSVALSAEAELVFVADHRAIHVLTLNSLSPAIVVGHAQPSSTLLVPAQLPPSHVATPFALSTVPGRGLSPQQLYVAEYSEHALCEITLTRGDIDVQPQKPSRLVGHNPVAWFTAGHDRCP